MLVMKNQTKTQSKLPIRLSRLESIPRQGFAICLLLFVVLASQTIAASHSHDDFEQHVDCVICVKAGNESDALPVSLHPSTKLEPARATSTHLHSEYSAVPLVTRSRGPPLNNS